MSLKRSAYAVGFSNQTHFSVAFKKFYGVPSSDYIVWAKAEENGTEMETT